MVDSTTVNIIDGVIGFTNATLILLATLAVASSMSVLVGDCDL